jgi:acid phosphatase type 7
MKSTDRLAWPGAMACAAGLLWLASPAALAAQRTAQLAEDGVQTRTLAPVAGPLADAPPTRVCETGARWMRLNVSDLALRSYDSLVLTSSGGDRYVLQGSQRNGRRFTTRALRGSCIDIRPAFGSADSRYRIDGYQFGTRALADTPVVVAGAGDICDSSPADCGKTSDLIVAINPTSVFTAGDNAYSSGTLSEYNTLYAPRWGRFKALTNPSPGNHDYLTSSAAGYFDYFNGAGNQTGPAGDRSKGYYSYDVGDWHFVALNTMSGGTVATAQLNWLTSDLAATTKPCIAAYFHHPQVSRGNYSGYSQVKPIMDRLYAAHADLALVGHDHNYQRYAKMDGSQAAKADGLRQILIGTGGRDFYGLSGTHALLEASQDHTWGVLKLSLTATGYTGEFVPVAGKTWTDTFSGTCNPKGDANAAPVANFSSSASGLTVNFTDASSDIDGTIASRSWNFGDGTTSTATSPGKTYAAAGTYTVTLTVTDDDGATNTKSAQVTVSTGGGTELTNGVPRTGLSGAAGSSQVFSLAVPAGAAGLRFASSGGTGDADLYVKFNATPTSSSYDCKSEGSTNTETCTIATAQTGTYYVLVKGYAAFSGLSLTGSYTVGGSTQTYANTADYAIADNATVDSPITVSGRSGNAPSNASVTVAIVHTYSGDLKVDLVAPDGTLYNLHNRTGGSADNVNKTVTLNLSSEALNGTWKLRVNDNAGGDTGRIDSWSITF